MKNDNEMDVLLRCLSKDPNVAIKVLAQIMCAILLEHSEQPEQDCGKLMFAMTADIHTQLKLQLTQAMMNLPPAYINPQGETVSGADRQAAAEETMRELNEKAKNN